MYAEMNNKNVSSDKIIRFRKSEISLHWAIAVPFIVCYFSALVLIIFYNPHPERPYREIVSWIHRISGISLFVLPLLSALRGKQDLSVFFYNIRHSFAWTLKDLKWLFLMGLAAISKKITLPDQGKFNAAEKLHFISLTTTYPLYIVTGILIWNTNSALLPWFIHYIMALMATPFMFSHIFMATLNPHTRVAFSGMTSGLVDRHYVKNHHASWYKEVFEVKENAINVHIAKSTAKIDNTACPAQEAKS